MFYLTLTFPVSHENPLIFRTPENAFIFVRDAPLVNAMLWLMMLAIVMAATFLTKLLRPKLPEISLYMIECLNQQEGIMFGILLALILSITDFITEGFFSKPSAAKLKFISFSAGISISYIFLVLLPEVYSQALSIDRILFLPVLIGFSLFHIVEKFIRQNFHGSALRKEHYMAHSFISFAYFFVVGYILVKVADNNHTVALLLFFPLLLHIIIDSLPRRDSKHILIRVGSASSALLGALLSYVADFGILGNTILLGIVGGGLLYHVIRESLPKEREGKPMYFLIGLLLFTVLVLSLWNLGF